MKPNYLKFEKIMTIAKNIKWKDENNHCRNWKVAIMSWFKIKKKLNKVGINCKWIELDLILINNNLKQFIYKLFCRNRKVAIMSWFKKKKLNKVGMNWILTACFHQVGFIRIV